MYPAQKSVEQLQQVTKLEKEKREPRDFKSEKRARSFVQKRFGVIFCSCSSNCIVMCIRIHGAEHTGGTFFKQESKCRQHLAFVNSSCELRAATTQFWLKNSHRHCCLVGSGVTNSGYQNQLYRINKKKSTFFRQMNNLQ